MPLPSGPEGRDARQFRAAVDGRGKDERRTVCQSQLPGEHDAWPQERLDGRIGAQNEDRIVNLRGDEQFSVLAAKSMRDSGTHVLLGRLLVDGDGMQQDSAWRRPSWTYGKGLIRWKAQQEPRTGLRRTPVLEPREDDSAPTRSTIDEPLLEHREHGEALRRSERFLRDARQDELALAAVCDRYLGGEVCGIEREGAEDAGCARALDFERGGRERVVVCRWAGRLLGNESDQPGSSNRSRHGRTCAGFAARTAPFAAASRAPTVDERARSQNDGLAGARELAEAGGEGEADGGRRRRGGGGGGTDKSSVLILAAQCYSHGSDRAGTRARVVGSGGAGRGRTPAAATWNGRGATL